MRRRARVVVTAAVLAALAAPVVLDRDGIPLSTYPMYAGDRGREIALVTANALDADGERHRLSPRLIGRSDDPLVVAGELRAAVRADRAGERCAEIASRVATSGVGRPDVSPLRAIEVVTELHDTVDRASGRTSLRRRIAHATCEVPS